MSTSKYLATSSRRLPAKCQGAFVRPLAVTPNESSSGAKRSRMCAKSPRPNAAYRSFTNSMFFCSTPMVCSISLGGEADGRAEPEVRQLAPETSVRSGARRGISKIAYRSKKAVFHGEERRRPARRHADLLEETLVVMMDRAMRDPKLRGDLF